MKVGCLLELLTLILLVRSMELLFSCGLIFVFYRYTYYQNVLHYIISVPVSRTANFFILEDCTYFLVITEMINFFPVGG